jgi:hypothetical protein
MTQHLKAFKKQQKHFTLHVKLPQVTERLPETGNVITTRWDQLKRFSLQQLKGTLLHLKRWTNGPLSPNELQCLRFYSTSKVKEESKKVIF